MEELLGKETSWGFSHQATGRTTSKPSTCPSGRSLGRSRGGAETGTLLGNRQKLEVEGDRQQSGEKSTCSSLACAAQAARQLRHG